MAAETKENNRPIVDAAVVVRTLKTDTAVTYRVADLFDVTLTRDAKERWSASVPRLRTTNLSGAQVLTDGYDTEKPGDWKSTVDHAFLHVTRAMRSLAEMADSETVSKSQGVAALTAKVGEQDAVIAAQTHAMEIMTGESVEPLTAAERALLPESILGLADAKLPVKKSA